MNKFAGWCDRNKFGIILLPWLVAFASDLSLKYSILISGGFRESALGLGHPGPLTTAETIALFRSDLWLCSVFIPLGLCLLSYWLPLRVRILPTALFALAAEVILTFETTVYTTTGSFTSIKLLWVVITWTIHSHDTNIISVPLHEEIGIAGWILGVVLSAAIAMAAVRKSRTWLNAAALILFGAGAIAAVVASIPRLPDTAWKPSLLGQTAHDALEGESADADMLSRSVPELLQLYRATNSVPLEATSPYTGKARDYNVLLIVMESIPAQVFDPSQDSLSDMPNVRKLREHAFVLGKHYTTFPLTNCAAFAIFTSMYAKASIGELMGDREIELPGLIRNLNAAGYKTGFYGYVWRVPDQRDDRMLASLGFEKVAEPTIDPVLDRQGSTTFEGPIDYVEGHDLQALQFLKEDIHRWAGEKQKFAAAFFPEMGHDPWRELSGHVSKSVEDRGHALAAYEDAWIGVLVDELDRDGLLNDTIILISSDHGLRRTRERVSDPPELVAHGKLEDITMRVPMLIYVPQVLAHPVKIDYPTSHLDITPTILDLLGISTGREFEQGLPVTSPGIIGRRLFISMDIFGATGFSYHGMYYMEDGSKTVFENSTLHFEDGNALPYNGVEAIGVRKTITDQDALQNSLLTQILGRRVR
jgi:arylsulfatase A-like enzyme